MRRYLLRIDSASFYLEANIYNLLDKLYFLIYNFRKKLYFYPNRPTFTGRAATTNIKSMKANHNYHIL